MFLVSSTSRPIVCSAAEMTVDSGAFATTIPRRVAASTSTLSMPTPARPMTLRLSARAQVGRHLRRRADDDPVVAADRLSEVGVAVDIDFEAALAQKADTGLRDLLADENLGQT